MDYLIRFIQMHETFRKPETDALAKLSGVTLDWIYYSDDSPFAVVRFPHACNGEAAAKALVARSILSSGIYELWGSGEDYAALHEDVRYRTRSLWKTHCFQSFRFEVDSFQGSCSTDEKRDIIESFSYTGFEGRIKMSDPDNQFTVFEEYDLNAPAPKKLYLGRLLAESGRKAIAKYTLKKRNYIATTSMDAELSLVTANMALAAPGKLAYDPFMGTGSFPLACAHFGAAVFGSDLDGRSIRGKKTRSVKGNFDQYKTSSLYLGSFIADLTNTPLREERRLDSILCDPPYGVREGLKVLGSTKVALREEVKLEDGTPAHLSNSYIPPKKPYSFIRMLDDILDFSAARLVDDGRLCMWMPVAGAANTEDADAQREEEAEETEYAIPEHPQLELVAECIQQFNKWSRRLLVYHRRRESEVDDEKMQAYKASQLVRSNAGVHANGGTADDLNAFRRQYFQGFKESHTSQQKRRHEQRPPTD